MEIFVRGDKIEVTKAIQEYANEKLSRIEKYIGDSGKVRATVVVSVKNHNQKVEVTIPLKSIILRAEETKDDLYAAIDIVTDKLERQIRKNKTKLQSKKMKEKFSKDLIYDAIATLEDDSEEQNKIVKRKSVEVKPMSEEEAILQMELLEHQFYIFKDSETNKVAVVYKRKEGDYGIIESE
ncbi:MAG: ribosome-associated translation inhibitor RaiA [Bacilli bacterium]|nr:ribosome-associated translation inhibitor RaiA [Bacilli bacterium]